jgi:hypothetical protein
MPASVPLFLKKIPSEYNFYLFGPHENPDMRFIYMSVSVFALIGGLILNILSI